VAVLRRDNSSIDDISEALKGLAALMSTGWTSRENCEKIILKARVFQDLDRLEVEEMLSECLLHEGSRC
jgi:hypothetical protein